MEPECECAGPGFCPRYQIEQGEHHVNLCRNSPEYRAKWRARIGQPPSTPLPVTTLPIIARPKSKPMNPEVKCYLEAGIAEECKSCNSHKRALNHVRYCDHADNEDGRCTRGPNSVPGMWSCGNCAENLVQLQVVQNPKMPDR